MKIKKSGNIDDGSGVYIENRRSAGFPKRAAPLTEEEQDEPGRRNEDD
jgi:hypothetical protein